jgi:CheY-like chemotaxis protein/anti-sigma regulatory factor (Ser/Thr protein kinase)
MINIISNAIKYTNKGGSVSCTIRELKNSKRGYSSFLFTVKDNGIGISEDFLKHIYDPFTREQNTTSSGVEGTGLGMSIVKNLVDLLGGEINIESKLGEGTKVSVSLTLRQVKSNVKEVEKKEVKYSSLQKKKVLVVEDNDLNREIISSILREEGLEVVEAVDGSDAINILKKNGVSFVDFILMDIQMPVMDGYEATAKIREMEGSKAIPIIALSANAFEEDKRKSIKSGMNAHLSKPINIRELMKTLEEFGRGD